MFVKIGNKVHSSAKEPILLVLTPTNKVHLSNLREDNIFCAAPSVDIGFNLKDFMEFSINELLVDTPKRNRKNLMNITIPKDKYDELMKCVSLLSEIMKDSRIPKSVKQTYMEKVLRLINF